MGINEAVWSPKGDNGSSLHGLGIGALRGGVGDGFERRGAETCGDTVIFDGDKVFAFQDHVDEVPVNGFCKTCVNNRDIDIVIGQGFCGRECFGEDAAEGGNDDAVASAA